MDRLFSFVLPAYKAHFLKEAIDSILAQTYTNFELIIVNDASPEDLNSIVSSYDDSRIRYYVNKDNIGGRDLVAQWNYSISYAKGEYLILASDDDIYHSTFLAKMDTLIKKYPEVNLFRPRTQRIDALNNTIHVDGIMPELTSPSEFAYCMGIVGKGIPFYVFKTRKLKESGGFISYPLAWHSDDATLLKMANRGCVFLNEILFSFRLSGENISSKKNTAAVLKSKIIATCSFYDSLPLILSELSEWNEMDSWYKQAINSNIEAAKGCMIRSEIEESSKTAILKSWLFVLKSRAFSYGSLLKLYIRCLLIR